MDDPNLPVPVLAAPAANTRRRGPVQEGPNLTPETLIRFKTLEEVFKTARQAIKWIGIFGLAWLFKDALVALAGHSTSVFIAMSLQLFADVHFVVSVALAGACAAWAVVERVIRQKRVEQLHTRVKELEAFIDPQRTSSNLTPKGKTNPRDRKM